MHIASKRKMAKIINVDFKNKKREFTWDDDAEMKSKVTRQLNDDFHHVLDKIIYLTDNDTKFQEYCARILGGINANLKSRIQ